MNDIRKRRALELMRKYYSGIIEDSQTTPELESVSISGTILNFNTDIVRPLKSLILNIEPKQDESGYDSVNITMAGKNLLSTEIFANRPTVYTVTDGIVTVLKSDATAWAATSSFFLKAGTYTFSRTNTSGRAEARLLSNNYQSSLFAIANGVRTITFTLEEDDHIVFKVGNGASKYPFNTQLQIEVGSTATTYEPYNGTTYPITFPSSVGTVYSGILNVTTGQLITEGITYQLIPTDINTLMGINNIWMDANGTIDAEYWRIRQ